MAVRAAARSTTPSHVGIPRSTISMPNTAAAAPPARASHWARFTQPGTAGLRWPRIAAASRIGPVRIATLRCVNSIHGLMSPIGVIRPG